MMLSDTMSGCSLLSCWNKLHLKDLHWTKNTTCNKAGSRMKIVRFDGLIIGRKIPKCKNQVAVECTWQCAALKKIYK